MFFRSKCPRSPNAAKTFRSLPRTLLRSIGTSGAPRTRKYPESSVISSGDASWQEKQSQLRDYRGRKNTPKKMRQKLSPQVNIMQNALCDLATVRKTPQMAAGYLRHAV